MNDPLTEKQKQDFFNDVKEAWENKYNHLLKSGAIGEDDLEEGNYVLARIALIIIANEFKPRHQDHLDLLEKCRQF
jgi:hypothetical protein